MHTHLGLLLILLAVTPAAGAADVMEVRALEGTFDREVFDRGWLLPQGPGDRAARRGPWLVDELKLLAARRYGREGDRLRCLGDVLRRARAAQRTPGWIEALVDELRREQPELHRDLEPYLAGWLDDAELVAGRWNPDSEAARDGVVFAAPWNLADERGAPWRTLRGSKLVQQATAILFADLESIKEVENDYRAYPRRPGSSYRWIGAVPGSFVGGEDPELGPFSALHLRFRCDLPFPFGGYSCDLAILNRLDRDGHLVTDIHSPHRDFLWLAGRDVFVPVHDASGEWVATLLVRLFGFDLAGVPDRDSHRRAALRGSLGNLKRDAEVRFNARSDGPRTVAGALPAFAVRGLRD